MEKNPRIGRHYRNLIHQGDESDGWTRKRAVFSIKELEKLVKVENLRVLSLGCGLGYECEEWKKKNNYVIGGDLNERYIKNAKSKGYADETFFVDLMLPINQQSESWDVIYSSEVFEHLLTPQPFISESYRLLKKGGFLLITTDNPCNFRNLVKMMKQDSTYFHVDGHNQYFSPADMKKLLESNGFEILKLKNIGNWPLAELGQVYLVIAKKI
ncbi:MAG: class I SAM-dependent methyltransferase [archaeon]|nr:class I SAM-dependent methyltransferase [archaeon]